MSPEQCRGDELDARSDVYSLGAMFYEMLAGTPPFVAETQTGVMAKHLFDPPPPLPKELDIPVQLERVIRRALAKEPEARPMDASALGRELQEAEQQEHEDRPSRRKVEHPDEKSGRVFKTLPSPTTPAPPQPDTGEGRKAETDSSLTQPALTELSSKGTIKEDHPVSISAASLGLEDVPVLKRRGAGKIWIALGLLVAVGLAIGLAVKFSNSNSSTDTQGTTNSVTPTPSLSIVAPNFKLVGVPFPIQRNVFKIALSPIADLLGHSVPEGETKETRVTKGYARAVPQRLRDAVSKLEKGKLLMFSKPQKVAGESVEKV